jgi:hypothetical protein
LLLHHLDQLNLTAEQKALVGTDCSLEGLGQPLALGRRFDNASSAIAAESVLPAASSAVSAAIDMSLIVLDEVVSGSEPE